MDDGMVLKEDDDEDVLVDDDLEGALSRGGEFGLPWEGGVVTSSSCVRSTKRGLDKGLMVILVCKCYFGVKKVVKSLTFKFRFTRYGYFMVFQSKLISFTSFCDCWYPKREVLRSKEGKIRGQTLVRILV
ncbi:hypothetical protein CTI12_AA045970 [Artemisia annua]|uniref:Uncharacterized protein n=1 Tax=Artemisia annua TaxID=35608 RepID=A0A2U1PA93_ARTAN|nr:hypothetical protein CTI12_AA045970 [Artemisia annua]